MTASIANPCLFKLNTANLDKVMVANIVARLRIPEHELPSLRFRKLVPGLYLRAGADGTLPIEDRYMEAVEGIPLINKPTEFRRLHWSEISYSGSDFFRSSGGSKGRRVLKKAKS